MKQLISTLIFLLSMQLSYGQEWKTVPKENFQEALIKCSEIYRSENYVLKIEQKLKRDARLNEAAATESALFVRGKGTDYSISKGNLFIVQQDRLKIVADTGSRIINILSADSLFNPLDTYAMLEKSDWAEVAVKKAEVKGEQHYLLTGIKGFQSLELTFYARSGALKNVSLDFAPSNYESESFEDETLEQPRLELSYSEPSKLSASQRKMLDLSAWITEKNHKTEPSASRSGYTINDFRLPQ